VQTIKKMYKKTVNERFYEAGGNQDLVVFRMKLFQEKIDTGI